MSQEQHEAHAVAIRRILSELTRILGMLQMLDERITKLESEK